MSRTVRSAVNDPALAADNNLHLYRTTMNLRNIHRPAGGHPGGAVNHLDGRRHLTGAGPIGCPGHGYLGHRCRNLRFFNVHRQHGLQPVER